MAVGIQSSYGMSPCLMVPGATTSKADKIHTEAKLEHVLQPALAELPGKWRPTRPTGWPLPAPGILRLAQGESVLGKGPRDPCGE